MIVFELICPEQHRFEGWFASAGDFDGQKAGGLLSCPSCGHSGIEKLLTAKIGSAEVEKAPVRRSRKKNSLPVPAQMTVKLHELIGQVLKNTEDVGAKFAEEARRMHYAEVPERAIRGTASRQETEELLDEGIPVMPLPIPPQGDWH
jgi:hypothetical protein